MGRRSCGVSPVSYDPPVKPARATFLFAGLLLAAACEDEDRPAPPIEITSGGSNAPGGGVNSSGTNSGGTNSGGTNSTTASGTVDPNETDSDPTAGTGSDTDTFGTMGTASDTGTTGFTATDTDVSLSLTDSASATDMSASDATATGGALEPETR
jgi:hypothetical protein